MLALVSGVLWWLLGWFAWAAGWLWGWAGVVWWQAVLPAAQVATHGFGVAYLWERAGRWWDERRAELSRTSPAAGTIPASAPCNREPQSP